MGYGFFVMTLEITNNPHGFLVFLTLSMGLSYGFFNRPGFNFGKGLVLVLIGLPILLIAYQGHHMVDVGLGLVIGYLHSKNMLGMAHDLFQRLRCYLQGEQYRHTHEQTKQKNTDSQNHKTSSNTDYDEFKHRYQVNQQSELENAFAILGVASTATREQTKRAYRKMAKAFHSDVQSGASQASKKAADEKMAEVNIAWGMIKKARKWR